MVLYLMTKSKKFIFTYYVITYCKIESVIYLVSSLIEFTSCFNKKNMSHLRHAVFLSFRHIFSGIFDEIISYYTPFTYICVKLTSFRLFCQHDRHIRWMKQRQRRKSCGVNVDTANYCLSQLAQMKWTFHLQKCT